MQRGHWYMRIFWWSNAPWTHTGYGNQTRLFVPRIQALGHTVILGANYGLDGAVLDIDNGVSIYPRGLDSHGSDVLAPHSERARADITITLYDSWAFDPSATARVRWCPWMPVDHEALPPVIKERIATAWQPIAYSRHGERCLREAGFDPLYVPHGVDTRRFCPGDRAEARERLGFVGKDTFLAIMVAANKGQPSRKAIPEVMLAWKALKEKHDDVQLYLHSHDGPEMQGYDLQLMRQAAGLEHGDVLFAEPYQLILGYPDAWMADLYRAADVLLSPSYGEGFGIPIVEAQACGCPVIAGDWSSMGELVFGGWKVGRDESQPFYTPLGGWMRIPYVSAIYERLEAAYAAKDNERLRKKARAGATRYDVDLVTKDYWKPALETITEQVELAHVDEFDPGA